MCGIAGIAGRPDTNPDPRRLDAMRRALAHRGPDGVGQETVGQVGLVHTRLAIIDLVTGDQPVGRKNLICHVMRQDRTRDVARRVRISR